MQEYKIYSIGTVMRSIWVIFTKAVKRDSNKSQKPQYRGRAPPRRKFICYTRFLSVDKVSEEEHVSTIANTQNFGAHLDPDENAGATKKQALKIKNKKEVKHYGIKVCCPQRRRHLRHP